MNSIKYFFFKLFDVSDFPARWFCGKWSDFHGWLYIFSNLLIWASYFAIPAILLYFSIKRKDVPFKGIFLLFVFFILLCGLSHLIDAVIFWMPVYRLNAVILFCTGIVSTITVISLFKVLPSAFELKTPQELSRILEQRTAELKQANLELESSKDLLKKLIDNNPDAISKLDKNYKHLFVNKSITKHLDVSPEIIEGKTYDDLAYPNKLKRFLEKNIDKAIESGNILQKKIKSLDLTENEISLNVVFVPLANAERGEVEVLTIARDITKEEIAKKELAFKIKELNKTTKTLRDHNKQMEDFSYIVSHNLRSPINNIISLLELYELERESNNVKLNDNSKEIFDHLKKVTLNLNITIQELTEIINIKLHKFENTKVLYFSDLLFNLKESLKSEIESNRLEVIEEFEADSIEFVKAYMESILQNLLTNAIKYRDTEKKSYVKFSSRNKENKVVLTCEDNGLGIDMAKFGNDIFSLSKTFHNHPDARGVGLFMTKNQIEAFGGSISVTSEPSVGTTFTLTFMRSK
ncbi:sensor histidine kinase [Chondrinema litorale]|uniref:sensor histidine kinase n=1 Tax=Chondrinema litorale TaxID=2994555 RepID=UPI002542F595|nr:PAS domain-containing sensor histidine kinase [Chondrinema litorale]UZR94398.1 PAS domain-containing sensor histidine kinase [Chondrinema litorale]